MFEIALEMSKNIFRAMAIVALCVVTLAITLFFSVQHSKKLVKENEQLILKNDSLHILELKANKELVLVQMRLDSLIRRNGKYARN